MMTPVAGPGRQGRSIWWARQGSNLRPLGCKPSALPLSYAPGTGPGPGVSRWTGQARASAATARRHPFWSRASPTAFTSANRTMPSLSTRKVPRWANPAPLLSTP